MTSRVFQVFFYSVLLPPGIDKYCISTVELQYLLRIGGVVACFNLKFNVLVVLRCTPCARCARCAPWGAGGKAQRGGAHFYLFTLLKREYYGLPFLMVC